ncbi:bacteriocin immunity protein [Pseudomonas sp. KNUC1026]|nr:bacteriocin immunity protein [Pseudomonas sp. KNUC1026]
MCPRHFEMNTTSEKEHERWAIHFGEVTQHPRSWDLIFYPIAGEDNTPSGVVNEVKQWRATNNLPGFKESGTISNFVFGHHMRLRCMTCQAKRPRPARPEKTSQRSPKTWSNSSSKAR